MGFRTPGLCQTPTPTRQKSVPTPRGYGGFPGLPMTITNNIKDILYLLHSVVDCLKTRLLNSALEVNPL